MLMAVDFDKQEVSLRSVLASCSHETRRVAKMWFYYTLFYWMLPTVIVIFGLALARKQIKWLDLVIHGELLIYAITIVAGSTRLVAKDVPKRGPFVNRQAFNLTSHVMIFPAIFAYGLIRYIGATTNTYDVSTFFVVTYSVVLLIAAFIFSYIVFLIDAQRSTPDELPKRVAAEIAHAPDKLTEEFSELQKKDPAVTPQASAPQESIQEEIEEEEIEEAVVVEAAQPETEQQAAAEQVNNPEEEQ